MQRHDKTRQYHKHVDELYNRESWCQVSLYKKFGEQVPSKCIHFLEEGGDVAAFVFSVQVFEFVQLLAYL